MRIIRLATLAIRFPVVAPQLRDPVQARSHALLRGDEDFAAVAPTSEGRCVVAEVGIRFACRVSCYTKYGTRRQWCRTGRAGKGEDAQGIAMILTMAECRRVCRCLFVR